MQAVVGGGDVTEEMLSGAISNHNGNNDAHSGLFNSKQDKITNEDKLSYSLISGTPSIPSSTSDLVNDSFIPSSFPVIVGNISNNGNYVNSGNVIMVNNVNLLGNTSGNLILNTSSTTPNISGNNSIILTTDGYNSSSSLSSFCSYSINIGNNYMKTSRESIVEGYKNDVTGNYNVVAFGNYNRINYSYNNYVFGYGLDVGFGSEFTIGKYNATNYSNYFFSLGDGASVNSRHTLIEINNQRGMKYDKGNLTSAYYDPTSTSGIVIGHDIIACAGLSQAINAIPVATSSIILRQGVYTHVPSNASVYILSAPKDTCTTDVVIYIKFTNTQSYTFKDWIGNIVTPLSTPTIEVGSVVCFLCIFSTLSAKWVIMPIEMGV